MCSLVQLVHGSPLRAPGLNTQCLSIARPKREKSTHFNSTLAFQTEAKPSTPKIGSTAVAELGSVSNQKQLVQPTLDRWCNPEMQSRAAKRERIDKKKKRARAAAANGPVDVVDVDD